MSYDICEICGEKGFLRCEKHNKCDGCGKNKKELVNSDIHLVHRIEGLYCDDCWKDKMQERIEDFKGDTEYTQNIVCPYCGYEDIDSWEYSNDDGEIECNDCGNKFDYSRNINVDYSTEKYREAHKSEGEDKK